MIEHSFFSILWRINTVTLEIEVKSVQELMNLNDSYSVNGKCEMNSAFSLWLNTIVRRGIETLNPVATPAMK